MMPNPVKVGFGPFAVFSQPISKKETFGQPYTHKIHTNISEKTGEAQRKKEASAEKKKKKRFSFTTFSNLTGEKKSYS